MARLALKFLPAICLLLSFSSTALSQKFPKIKDFANFQYEAEVLLTDDLQEISTLATEYYDSIETKGALKISSQGNKQLIYFDNSTFEITEVNGPNCSTTDVDTSVYDYIPLHFGWLNKDPIIVGPSAALWYAQTRRKDIKYAKTEVVRSIKCDKFTLGVKNNFDDLTYEYYFATPEWSNPYEYGNLRTPIRIRISGKSSRFSAKSEKINQTSDFTYFKPYVSDSKNLLPPTGIGCRLKAKTDNMPSVPDSFQYTAEVVDLLADEERFDNEMEYQKTWYDHKGLIARRDIMKRREGINSTVFDFRTGTLFKIDADGNCNMAGLRNTDFQKYDYGLTSRMKEPKEMLNLDGDFYEMGYREIRGKKCQTFESVQFDKHFKGTLYKKLVVTAYFTESGDEIRIDGDVESRILVCITITGYDTSLKKTLQVQYNIFGFNDVIWPEMYSSFQLHRCYTDSDSKANFVLVLNVPSKYVAQLQDQDEAVISELGIILARYANVTDMRIPYLKAEYKKTAVLVTGVMLERSPASIQFYEIDSGSIVTKNKNIKVIPEAKNKEQCSYKCVDEGTFLCKGFYLCNKVCFLKSNDPTDTEDNGDQETIDDCTEYIRDEIDSTNFRESYLTDALENLKKAVSAGNITISIFKQDGKTKFDEEVFRIQDVIIGERCDNGDY